MRALLALNGKIDDMEALRAILETLEIHFVVGVDGGIKHLQSLGYVPNIMIGDFDSFELEGYAEVWPDVEIMRFNKEKDMTDAELAFSYIQDKRFNDIIAIGAFGGRLDHLLGNVFLLEHYPNIMLLDAYNRVKLLEGPAEKTLFQRKGFLSLIPITERVEGVTLKGFKYPLDEVVIKRGSTWGISNEFVAEEATIRFEKGKMLVIIAEDY
ncbi:MAG: thiamine pyrophosphokinae [Clostridiales bacterium]|jgi:thiamine pyrophosphokinase|nr:thiamine pyrophosphokinae [Clostridiales bacterium]